MFCTVFEAGALFAMLDSAEPKSRRPLVEHHPALDLRQVLKAKIDARVRVEWQPDHGFPVAEAIIQIELLALEMDWGHLDGHYKHVRLAYDFERADYGAPREVWFMCPGCREHRRKLHLYVGAWNCRKCHNLGHVKQYITKYDKLLEERQSLRAELKGGRKRYQHHDAFEAKQLRLGELERLVAGMKPSHTHQGVSTRRVSAVYSPE